MDGSEAIGGQDGKGGVLRTHRILGAIRNPTKADGLVEDESESLCMGPRLVVGDLSTSPTLWKALRIVQGLMCVVSRRVQDGRGTRWATEADVAG
jgi:hypothetical protein